MNYVLLFGMPGGGELFFIVLVIIMLFGSKKIPELARGLGKGMREIKNATGDIQREIRDGAQDLNSIKDKVDVQKQVKDLLKDDAPDPKRTESEEAPDVEEEKVSATSTVPRRGPYDSKDSETPDEVI